MTTATLPKEPESKMQVRFPDCDPFNHLNNSKYIDYIINAREDQLIEHYDFDIHKIARETGLAWVVAQTQIAYVVPVNVMEIITIQTRLITFSPRSLLFEAVIYDRNKTHVKAVLWSKLAHFNLKTKQSHEHSAEMTALFSEVQFHLPDNPTFEDRVKQIRQYSAIG